MEDIVFVKVFKTENDATHKEFDNMLWELLMSSYLEPEISTRHIIHDQIQIHPILEGVNHVYQEGMLQLAQ